MFYIKRKIKDMFRNAISMVGLLILLASMGLLIFLVVQFGKSFPGKMADMIGFGDESGEKEPETEDGVVPSENLPVGAAAPKQ